MRRGYFIGTGILAKHELKEVFKVLQSQAESLEDPVAVGIYQAFKDRMQNSNILEKDELAKIYPVRAIANQAIVDIDCLPDYAVYKKLAQLEEAIEKGELLELNRILGTGRIPGDPHQHQPFRCYPLQIVFHNIGWYLGYECEDNLFRFERLDRIFLMRSHSKYRSSNEQMMSLKKLEKLYKAGLGIFLGNSAEDQRIFLSNDKHKKASVEVTVELWFKDQTFKFIWEGTRRFPKNQMKMSKPLGVSQPHLNNSIFSLSPSKDPNFPHRFQVKLPKWALGDVELKRWIVGFGGEVTVVQPPELVEAVQKFAKELLDIYTT